MSECVCPEPGWCERYHRRMVGRPYELCSGKCPPTRPCPEPARTAYLARLAGQPAQAPRPRPAPKGGPGTELKAMFAALGLPEKDGCGCGSIAAWMDRLGPEGCREHAEEILCRLREAQAKLGWLELIRAATNAAVSGLAFKLDPRDPAPGLLAEAIHRAKEKEANG